MARPVIVLIALVTAGASFAEDGPNYAIPGYYVVFQAGGAFFRNEATVDGVNTSVKLPIALETRTAVYSAPTKPSYGLRLGHRWKHFALEIDGDYIGGDAVVVPERLPSSPCGIIATCDTYPGQLNDPRTPEPEGEVRSFNLSLSGKYYPWTWRIQPYLAGGLGISNISPSPKGLQGETLFGGVVFSLRAGGGAEFYLTEHMYMDLGVTYYYVTGPANSSVPPSNNQSYMAVRGGLGWRFF